MVEGGDSPISDRFALNSLTSGLKWWPYRLSEDPISEAVKIG